MVAMPYGRYLENEEGLHATVSSWRRVDDTMIPPRGKIAGSYVNSAFAKTDAQRAGFDEAIVLNQDGHVSEASAANVLPRLEPRSRPRLPTTFSRHHPPDCSRASERYASVLAVERS
jgi:branched-subunit amino acid aminotransferase/4-amino-4-deoxychorismate lyase